MDILNILETTDDLVVPLDMAKKQCRVEGDDEDDLISLYVRSATKSAESCIKTALVRTQYELIRDFATGQPDRSPYRYWQESLRLPKPPLISVDAIKYRTFSGTWVTIDPDTYTWQPGTPARIVTRYGNFPITLPQLGSLAITFTAGYEDPADIPPNIIAGILLYAGHLYINREATVAGSMSELPMGVRDLWSASATGFYR